MAPSGLDSLTVTQRTIQAPDHVIQTRNVTRFGAGTVPRWWFTWPHMVGLGFFGLILLAMGQMEATMSLVGLVCLGLAGWGGYLKFSSPDRYGLVIALNSGEVRFYPTADKQGLERVTDRVAGLLESVEAEPWRRRSPSMTSPWSSRT